MAPSDSHSTAHELMQQQAFLVRLARALVRDEATADDLVQDTYTAALRRAESEPPSRAWLATVLRRLALTHYRARGRRTLREERSARDERVESHAAEIDRRLDLQALLADRLRALPVEQSRALALRFGEDLTPREIAARLREPEATIKARLRRGLARLRSELDAEHGGRESWALALLAGMPRSAPTRDAAAMSTTWIAAGGVVVALVVALALLVNRGDGSTTSLAPRKDGAPSVGEQAALELRGSRAEKQHPRSAETSGGAAPGPAAAQPATTGSAPVEEPAAPEEPFLAMKFDRQGALGGFLRLHCKAEADTTLSGRIYFDVAGVPRREVELRGLAHESAIELRVPALATVTISAELDGLVAQPVSVDAPADGVWLDVPFETSLAPDAAHLVLALTGDVPADGTRFFLELVTDSSTPFVMRLRSPQVEDGRIVIGGVPAGTVTVYGRDNGASSRRRFPYDVFVASARLAPGERAVVPAPIETCGRVRVDVVGERGEQLDAEVEVELADGARISARLPPPRGEDGPRLLGPPLPPGNVTLHLTYEGYLPCAVPVTIQAGEVGDVRAELRR